MPRCPSNLIDQRGGRGDRELRRRQMHSGRAPWGWPAGEQLLDLAPEFCEGLGEDGLAVRVAAPLAYVREVRLVRLGARRVRRIVPVLSGGKAAARAVPGVGNLRVAGEAGHRFVSVGAP